MATKIAHFRRSLPRDTHHMVRSHSLKQKNTVSVSLAPEKKDSHSPQVSKALYPFKRKEKACLFRVKSETIQLEGIEIPTILYRLSMQLQFS